jgi:hypothetical protein
MTANPPKMGMKVLLRFAICPLILIWLQTDTLIIANQNCQIKEVNCQKAPMSVMLILFKNLLHRSEPDEDRLMSSHRGSSPYH